jgi:hypothetical protein
MHNTGKFRIYLKNVDGNSRELLAWGDQSLHTPVVVAPFKDIWGSNPPRVAEYADYSDSMGIFTMQDVNQGEGMKGVAKGVAKTLRVVALRWRVSGACDQNFGGQLSGSKPADVIFSAPAICPVSLWGGSWDVKEVLGEAKIFEDGSASFKVPARTPVYFEVLDSNGCMIAGMRSWSTLMPGETFSCLGCHENKTTAPSSINTALAGKAQQLDKLLGVEDMGLITRNSSSRSWMQSAKAVIRHQVMHPVWISPEPFRCTPRRRNSMQNHIPPCFRGLVLQRATKRSISQQYSPRRHRCPPTHTVPQKAG